MTVLEKTIENFEKDKENFIIVQTEEGHNITNLRTLKMYKVYRENGKDKCSCPDFIYRRIEKQQLCKHLIAVKKLQEKKKLEIKKLIERW